MKATSDPAGPLFANFLYKALNIYVPVMRVLSFRDPNFKSMQTGLDVASYANHEKHVNMMKKLEKPFFLISEYIPGIYLHEIGI